MVYLRLADCVVRRDPESVRQMLIKIPGTPAESEAFRTLASQLSQCLAANDQLTIEKISMIGYFAEAFYFEALAGKEHAAG